MHHGQGSIRNRGESAAEETTVAIMARRRTVKLASSIPIQCAFLGILRQVLLSAQAQQRALSKEREGARHAKTRPRRQWYLIEIISTHDYIVARKPFESIAFSDDNRHMM
jgi:hypothetical protein